MKSKIVNACVTVMILAGLAATDAFARQNPGGRDFDTEIRAALQSAKSAAGFEHLGTLTRICLLPQSGGVNTSDNVPPYVRDPTTIPPRENWYADSAKVFDNLYFVGGRIHTSWALTTSEGIIVIDTIFPYNSEELIVGGLERQGLNPNDIRYVVISHAHGDHIGGRSCCRTVSAPRWSLEKPIGNWWRPIPTDMRRWRRRAASWPPTAWN